jgi:hypothetical protein
VDRIGAEIELAYVNEDEPLAANTGSGYATDAGRRQRTGLRDESPLVAGLLLARATGLEPATSGVTGRRSNHLNYARVGERG